jgi:hypothetical protein
MRYSFTQSQSLPSGSGQVKLSVGRPQWGAVRCALPLVIFCLMIGGCGSTNHTVQIGGSSSSITRDPLDASGGTWRTAGTDLQLLPEVAVPAPSTSAKYSSEKQDESVVFEESKTDSTRQEAIRYWRSGACRRWNETARGIVSDTGMAPPKAARLYALISVAQYDALVACWQAKYQYNRFTAVDSSIAGDRVPDYPSTDATVAAASSAVLKYVFPSETVQIEASRAQHDNSCLWAGRNVRSDVDAGDALGRAVAEQVIRHGNNDGSSQAVWAGNPPIPTGPGYWYPATGTGPTAPPPVLPLWGTVRPWLVRDIVAMRAGPPPAFGSPAYEKDLSEVRQISDTRTEQQVAIVRLWSDGAGTATPPGHWNQIACDLAAAAGLSEIRTARALALLNMAQMDASICCWDTKYHYYMIRPSEADPQITLPVGLPNFPSYTSGHSSFSGAASEVLSYLFPGDADNLRAMAQEASMSRIYGGIHYRFDCDAGLAVGRSIGSLAILQGRTDGSP